MRTRPVIALLLLAGALLLSGCVNFKVLNLSEVSVRVLIDTPDSQTGTTKLVAAGGIGDTFSTHGGGFRISILPDEEYRSLLLEVQEQINQRLFTEGGTLSSSDVADLVSRISQIDQALADLARPYPVCTGSAPDWSTVDAFVNYDSTAGTFTIDCSVTVSD
jgi:hypothetical protein